MKIYDNNNNKILRRKLQLRTADRSTNHTPRRRTCAEEICKMIHPRVKLKNFRRFQVVLVCFLYIFFSLLFVFTITSYQRRISSFCAYFVTLFLNFLSFFCLCCFVLFCFYRLKLGQVFFIISLNTNQHHHHHQQQ